LNERRLTIYLKVIGMKTSLFLKIACVLMLKKKKTQNSTCCLLVGREKVRDSGKKIFEVNEK
jgi:hypothetical protein